ncbi:MAG: DNA polymerase III subunit alpha [Burkholderiales bacterium]|nr:DNA polymerase III subunit alpha [Burkholderiales bacterium]
MPAPSFVHLRLHSEYSIVDGTLRIDDAVAAAAADGMSALALTDLANGFGLIKFYKATRSKGIKPIIGCDVWITHEGERDNPHRAVLLAADRDGYLRLCEWLTRAYRGNQHRGRAELRREWFDEGTAGIIALSGARDGDVGAALLQGDARAAEAAAAAWAARFPQRYYLEVQRADRPDDDALVAATVALGAARALPVVATHPVQFARPEDFRPHEARVCIAEGNVLADTRRPRRFTAQQYFATQAEMMERFADLPQALANSVAIAQRCNVTIDLGKNYLPVFPTPEGMTVDEHLRAEAGRGLERRLAQLYPDEKLRDAKRPEYLARLEFEAGTIVEMGFAGYFLIVADFINWARSNSVPVGPGRGSGAGSLVAYSLGITDLDPLRYALIFERFLNPERVSMPDFDIDFCQDGRDRVIDYVKDKYGADSVSQIATFGTLAAKAAVRDVGRVLDLPYSFVDGIAKLIPFQPGKVVTLKRRDGEAEANVIHAREVEPLIDEREAAEEEVRELLRLAQDLEGLPRNVGMHAGGVLIAPGKLTDFCPLYVQPGASALVSQFDKDDVEAVGLVKFDFLGLTTLTILDWTLRYVRLLDPASTLDLDSLPLDDDLAFSIFRAGNTTAVFQFESRGMRELLKQAPVTRFEDIIALVALYRPGPMELIPDFVARKSGRERPIYLDPRLEPILSPTYGVMVYQEQVMKIAQEIGGYTLGGADLLRRAMGKKKPEEMAKHRGIFVAGAAKNGVAEAKATQLFDLMEKFAGYGFNKSHAAAYALVAYHTAYFKAHHPAPFMAANLSLVMDDTDKVRGLRDDALAQGLAILPPDVNASNYRFEPVDEKRIRYGLGGVKGTGQAAIEAIVAAREAGGPFLDLFDFCARIDKRTVNRRAIEALVKAGAFDAIEPRRAALLATVGVALDAAQRAQATAAQVSLFGEDEPASRGHALATVREWTEAERLTQEKTAIGYYLSGHPFHADADEIADITRTTLAKLAARPDKVLVAGIVTQVRVQSGRRGKMAFVTLDDGQASQEMMVYNETFDAVRTLLRDDQLVIAEVKVSQRMSEDGEAQGLRIIVETLYDLAAMRRQRAKRLRIAVNGNASAAELEALLAPYRPGDKPVTVAYRSARGISGEVDLSPAWSVNLDDTLIARLREWLSPDNVEIQYHESTR